MASDAKEPIKRFCPLNSEVLDIRLNSFLSESVSSCSVPSAVSLSTPCAADKISRMRIRILGFSFKSPSVILMKLIPSMRIFANYLIVLASELSNSDTDFSASLVYR